MTQKKALKIAGELNLRLKEIIPNFDMKLYGSYVRNEGTSDSDIDLYIEVLNEHYSKDLQGIINDLAWEYSYKYNTLIQITLYSGKPVWETPRRSSPFIQSIMKEGISI